MSTSSKYSCEPGKWQTEPVMILRDNESGSVVMVAPELGSNCVSFIIRQDGRELQVIETPASPEVLHIRASRGGVPVLWPFPGRVRDAKYSYNGKEYFLPKTDKNGIDHIHGLALTAKWSVTDYGSIEEGAFLVTTFDLNHIDPEIRPGYPFDFELSLRFVLKGQRLDFFVSIQNKEKQTAIPFSFGLHPYFRIPLASPAGPFDAEARQNCPIRVPAKTHWPAPGGIPDGPAKPTSPDKDFSDWKILGSQSYDDMYSDVILEDSGLEKCSIGGFRSPDLGLEVQVRADAQFRDWVLFTPPERASVAIEPYTSPPNAINSAKVDLSGSNLIELAPGASWNANIAIEVLKQQ